MSALADAPVSHRPAPAPLPDPSLGAVAALAEALAAAIDVDDVLRLTARHVCRALGAVRCAAYLRDPERGTYAGRAAHPAGDHEAAVRRLTVGGPTDPLTREVVATRAPVVVRDAAHDPRTALSAPRAWGSRSLLGLPLLAGDEVAGVLFADQGTELRTFPRARIELGATLAAIAAGALVRQQAAEDLRGRLESATRRGRLLRLATTAEHRLGQVLLDGGGLPELVALVSDLTGKPAALYDLQRQPVAAAIPSDEGGDLRVRLLEDATRTAAVEAALEEAAAGSCRAVGPSLSDGVRHRHLIAPVDVRGARWGWLVLMELPARFSALDELTARRAATHIAIELSAQRRAATATWDARSSLARQLVRGTSDLADARRSADHLGVALDVPWVVAYVAGRGGASIRTADLDRFAAQLRGRAGAEVLGTRGTEGLAVLVEVPAGEAPVQAVRRIRAAIAAGCEETGGAAALIAGVSAVCRAPEALPRAYREAREAARCLDRFGVRAGHRALAVDDLGPCRLFVANGDAAALDSFVADVVGPLLGGDDGSVELLRTLQCFFDTGRSVRHTATRLGVHENTVRYRLARVRTVTGLDVAAGADDQLSVQMALLVLRLQGHPALPSFDDEPAEAAA